MSLNNDAGTKLHDDYTFVTIDTSDTGFKSFSTPTGKKASSEIHSMTSPTKTPDSGRKSKATYGSSYRQFDYTLHVWNDPTPKRRCSVHILMPTGIRNSKFSFRVSTNMKELVIESRMSENAINPANGIRKYMLSDAKHFGFKAADLLLALQYHPKLVACNITASKLQGRNSEKTVVLQQRIPLPFACRHSLVDRSLDNDPFFFGKRSIEYENGEVWCHVELVGKSSDDYVAPASKKEQEDYFNLNSPTFAMKSPPMGMRNAAEEKDKNVKPSPIFTGFNSMPSPAYASTASRATIVDDMDTIVSASPTKRRRMAEEEFEGDGEDGEGDSNGEDDGINEEAEDTIHDLFDDDDL